MARINIEDELTFDPRFQSAVKALGCFDKAIGMAYRLYRLAQKYWGDGRQLIPVGIFAQQNLDLMLEVGLARRHDDGIYACGTRDHLEWYALRKEAAKEGGKRSAKARLEKNGTAIPDNARNTPTEANPKQNEPKPNPLALALALAQQDKVNIETTSNNHSPQPQQPPIGTRGKRAAPPKKKSYLKAIMAATDVERVIQLVGDREEEAKRHLGEEIFGILIMKYPVNTWWQVVSKQQRMYKNEKEGLWFSDLRDLFEAHFAETMEAYVTNGASLPVAPGSKKHESQREYDRA